MPTLGQHRAAARANELLAVHLASTEWKDWAAVVGFYTAMHWVDAYFADRINFHPRDHSTRERAVANTRDLDLIAAQYLALRRTCDRVRYSLAKLSDAEITTLLQDDVRRVREHVEGLLRS